MKKITLILFLFIIQNITAQGIFKPGLRAGVGFSNIVHLDGDYKTGFYVGGFGQFNLTKKYTIQPELTYSQEGAKNAMLYGYFDVNNEMKTGYRDLDVNSLSLAVINKITFESGLQLQIGNSYDFTLNKTSDVLENTSLSFIAGVAYRLKSGLVFESRIKRGYMVSNPGITYQIGTSYSFGGR